MSNLLSYLAAFLTGLLITVSFPTVFEGIQFPNMGFLIWFALVPFIRAVRYASLRQVAVLTFIMSFTCNSGTSYWIYHAMHEYGQLSPLSSLAGIASMASILAVMHACFVVFALWLGRTERVPLDLIFSSLWVLYEWVRNYGPFGGYPWSNLGYTQGGWLTFVQLADVFGVYGITFLIVFTNSMWVDVLEWFEQRRRFPFRQLVIVLLCIGTAMTYGHMRLKEIRSDVKKAPSLKVGLVQPNIPQEIKWRRGWAEKHLERLIHWTDEGIREGAEMIVWPEASYPDVLPQNLEQLTELGGYPVPIVIGAVTVAMDDAGRQWLYNSALQLDPGGTITERYNKQHLVPLGEYVPLQNVLWFLEKIVPAIGNFSPGHNGTPLVVDDQPYGVTICYEDLFPEISRRFVLEGADFIVNLTNDAWYKDSSQLDQHMNFSRFRAIENRRAMIRSTNTGRTAAIAPTGEILGQLPKFTAGVLVTTIPLLDIRTIYSRFGDVPWFLLLFGMLAISILIMKMRRRT